MTRARRAASAVVVALMLIFLLSFVALVIDLGYLRFVHVQLQVGADASAMAGAARLNRGASGLSDASATAAAIAAYNKPNGAALVLSPNPANDAGGDVVLGVWDAGGQTFTPSTTAKDVNAVRVRAHNPTLVPFFARAAFGRLGMDATATAIATHTALGAGQVPYYLPFALPRCLVDTWDEDSLQAMTFVLNPDGVDNTGWAGVDAVPSAAFVKDTLDKDMVCMKLWSTTGQVNTDCITAVVGSTVNVTNGVIDTGLGEVARHIETEGLPWDAEAWGALPARHSGSAISASKYGKMIVGPLPVFDGGSSYCTGAGGSWTQSAPLHGFIWGAVYDVRRTGDAANKNVWVRVNVKSVFEIGNWPGGGNWGVTATGPSEVVK